MLAAQRALTGPAAPALLPEIPGAGVAPPVRQASQQFRRQASPRVVRLAEVGAEGEKVSSAGVTSIKAERPPVSRNKSNRKTPGFPGVFAISLTPAAPRNPWARVSTGVKKGR
jgi:hypothetical protein